MPKGQRWERKWKLRSSYQINGLTWKVKLIRRQWFYFDGDQVVGATDFSDYTIKVAVGTRKKPKKVKEVQRTFWHEYFHAFLFSTECIRGVDPEKEERVADAFAEMVVDSTRRKK